MLRTLENFKETDDVRVSDLFENIDLLHHLLLRVCVLHVAFIDRFDRHLATGEFVNAKGNLAESTLPDELYEFIELERCGWHLLILLPVKFVVSDQALSFLHYVVIDTESVFIYHNIVDDLFSCSFG